MKGSTGWEVKVFRRIFNGRVYRYHDSYKYKKEVDKKAKRFRKKGFCARVLKRKRPLDYGYDLYLSSFGPLP